MNSYLELVNRALHALYINGRLLAKYPVQTGEKSALERCYKMGLSPERAAVVIVNYR